MSALLIPHVAAPTKRTLQPCVEGSRLLVMRCKPRLTNRRGSCLAIERNGPDLITWYIGIGSGPRVLAALSNVTLAPPAARNHWTSGNRTLVEFATWLSNDYFSCPPLLIFIRGTSSYL
jgi:hypothetical protein